MGRELARLRITVGSGLLRTYPPENARLLDEIWECGTAFGIPARLRARLRQFPAAQPPDQRLSQSVMVVEAAENSRALITVDWALEQGRDVFCLPSSFESPLSRGCHRLIKQGERLVEESAAILEEVPAFANLGPPVPLIPHERAVLHRLTNRSATPEALAATRPPLSSVERELESRLDKRMAAAGAGGGFSRHPDGATMARHGSPPF